MLSNTAVGMSRCLSVCWSFDEMCRAWKVKFGPNNNLVDSIHKEIIQQPAVCCRGQHLLD